MAACRVCSSALTTHLCDLDQLSHWRCRDCGSVFVGTELTQAQLASAYARIDSTSYYEAIATENRAKMRTAVEHLRGLLQPTSRVLDIGTGNGLFVTVLQEAGFRQLAVHELPGMDLKHLAGKATVYQDYDFSSLPPAAFDAVTLLDVAEHVPDPRALFAACHRVLAPGGLLYLHTPVVTRLDRFMHALHAVPLLARASALWQRGRTSIYHVQNYTPRAIEQVLTAAGFGAIRIEVRNELSWPLPMYVRLLLLAPLKLPGWLAPVIAPVFAPVLSTNLCNANKGIAWARKVA